ncbi:MAG: prepilin-type N-terminal cleavage/methylation domain-containing protein [Phycisphaerales bacterium JB039]
MRRAFTLVEILIVVVVLGILAAIVVPSIVNASDDASEAATITELGKLRRAVDAYKARENSLPDVTAGDGTWGGLVSSDYLTAPPVNAWVGRATGRNIVLRATPDVAFQDIYGWIYDPATGAVWAGGYDLQDTPFAK